MKINVTVLSLLIAFMLPITGCEDSNDYDHTIPAGKGSIVIDNKTGTDVDFFLNGILQIKVPNDSERYMDLDPGLYRMVLDEHNDYRSYSSDVDILDNRLTVVTIQTSAPDYYGYSVSIYFD
jgi:hypothetical protein